ERTERRAQRDLECGAVGLLEVGDLEVLLGRRQGLECLLVEFDAPLRLPKNAHRRANGRRAHPALELAAPRILGETRRGLAVADKEPRSEELLRLVDGIRRNAQPKERRVDLSEVLPLERADRRRVTVDACAGQVELADAELVERPNRIAAR